VTDK